MAAILLDSLSAVWRTEGGHKGRSGATISAATRRAPKVRCKDEMIRRCFEGMAFLRAGDESRPRGCEDSRSSRTTGH